VQPFPRPDNISGLEVAAINRFSEEHRTVHRPQRGERRRKKIEISKHAIWEFTSEDLDTVTDNISKL
jgi:hypothetical protein